MTLWSLAVGVFTRVLPLQLPLPAYADRHWRAVGVADVWFAYWNSTELFTVLFIPPLLFAGWLEDADRIELLSMDERFSGWRWRFSLVTVVGIGFLIYWLVPAFR